MHWSFDQRQNNRFDESSGAHPFVIRRAWGDELAAKPFEHARAVFGESLVLNDIGEYAVSSYPGVGDDRARTVAFWVRLPSEIGTQYGNCFLSWGTPEPAAKWEMAWNRDSLRGEVGALRVDFGRGNVIGKTDLRDSLWHHVAAVFYGGEHADVTTHVKLFVDGSLETITGGKTQRIKTLLDSSLSVPVTIGRFIDVRKDYPKAYFTGQLDELYIVEGPLSLTQIQSLRDRNEINDGKSDLEP